MAKTKKRFKIEILGDTWTIELHKKLKKRLGDCCWMHQRIRLSEEARKKDRMEVVAEEVLHTILPNIRHLCIHELAKGIAAAMKILKGRYL